MLEQAQICIGCSSSRRLMSIMLSLFEGYVKQIDGKRQDWLPEWTMWKERMDEVPVGKDLNV